MNKVALILTLIIFCIGCDSSPIYSKDTCFVDGLNIERISDIKDRSYIIEIYTIFASDFRIYEFSVYEDKIKSTGLVAESCEKYREKK